MLVDIPAYAVAVGVPAKVVKYRFPPEQIEALLQRQLWNGDEDVLQKVQEMFWDIDGSLEPYPLVVLVKKCVPFFESVNICKKYGRFFPLSCCLARK